jgi:hypothetical protein
VGRSAIYIAGALDISAAWLSDAIDQQPSWLPGLAGTHLLEGCGHWVQQECPDQANDLILDWLRAVPLTAEGVRERLGAMCDNAFRRAIS